ncbi:unnamed protein product [Vitrella brassicaformis CCMP3155]|uniref:DUF3752 domain-containing protein n=1 Tax=Vitrella brassicaformis (strain CCMP3155) TaxID=1169540 RepID=A0A0G4GDI7_VITBC|nr:unnamed protein product [Vitrella brassicaformis CCMP3155]|eukprot:CEM27473.1 unnamed protein product [Vitrella brassicaformis CCMP3155]
MSSASESSSDEGSRRRRKDKKKRKKKSKDKDGSDDDWFYERGEVERLVRDLLEINGSAGKELVGLLRSIDDGEMVILDGIADKTIRRKVRHLFKAFYLDEPAAKQSGFRKPPKARDFSFRREIKRLVKKAEKDTREAENEEAKRAADKQKDAEPPPTVPAKEEGPAAPPEPSFLSWESMPAAPTGPVENPSSAAGAMAGPPPPPPPPGKRRVGVAFPSRDDLARLQEGFQGGGEADEAQFGPMPTVDEEGEEGGGRPQRESWMTDAPDSLAAAFGQAPKRPKVDPFEAKRTEEERQAMEKYLEEYNKQHRGKSLLELQQEGAFSQYRDEQHKAMKRKADDPWGKTKGQQAEGGGGGQPWKRFDRDQDLEVKRQVNNTDFMKLVEKSQELKSKFSRSNVQTSFL